MIRSTVAAARARPCRDLLRRLLAFGVAVSLAPGGERAGAIEPRVSKLVVAVRCRSWSMPGPETRTRCKKNEAVARLRVSPEVVAGGGALWLQGSC